MTREEAIKELASHLVHWNRLKHEHIVPTDECENTINALRMAIEALSVEVVRCKDCCHRVHDEERGLYYCEKYYGQGDVSDENFCQWGERRKE